MFNKIRDKLIKLLGGYTPEEYLLFRDFRADLFKTEQFKVQTLHYSADFDENFYRLMSKEDVARAMSQAILKNVAPYLKVNVKYKTPTPCQTRIEAELKVIDTRNREAEI